MRSRPAKRNRAEPTNTTQKTRVASLPPVASLRAHGRPGVKYLPYFPTRNTRRPNGPRREGYRMFGVGDRRSVPGVGRNGPPGTERQSGVHRSANPHLHARRAADPAAVLPAVSPPRHVGAHVADDLSGGPALGALDPAEVTSREMPPWHIDRSIGEYLADPVSLRSRDRHDRLVGRCRRARGTARRRATAADVCHRFRVDLRRTGSRRPDGKGLPDSSRRSGLHPRRDRRSQAHRGSLRQVGADHSGRQARRPSRARVRRSARRHRSRRPRRSAWARTSATAWTSSSTVPATTRTSFPTARRRS